ncbi:MAG: metal-dependent hydrolase [Patescibacteria group bacterium]|jgi:membrane-bound metal-dependent hydrolase YbcI (DUF457 family)
MDTLSHAAWGATMIRKPSLVLWAALAGALPDIIPAIFGILRWRSEYFRDMVSQKFAEDPRDSYMIVYRYAHSLLPITLLAAVLAIFYPAWWLVTIPYYLHIFMDIFTHKGVWGTRLFYPISDFHIEGRDWWRNKWFSIVNWCVLIVINAIIFLI